MYRLFLLAAAAWLTIPTHARAQTVLTLQETIARARDQAGVVAVARARIAEAEAALVDASARFRDNPIIDAAAGPRAGGGARHTELEVGLFQQFETGGQRRARIEGARAGIDRQLAVVREIARDVVFQAASAFLDGLAALERVRIAEEADTVSRELLAATERRYSAGDIAAVEVNLARIDAARSAALLDAARAELTAASGTLRTILRIPSTEAIDLRGSLDLPEAAPLEQLTTSVERRPEFARLAADVREAETQVQLARALQRPDLGFRVGYDREATDTVILGGLSIVIPAFQRGQGTLAAGVARASRARVELETTREVALGELRTAHRLYEARAAVAAALQKDTTPYLSDNESLGRRSYEAGEMNLMDFLLIRRDVLQTRTTIVDYRLEAARSRLIVDFVAGVLQ